MKPALLIACLALAGCAGTPADRDFRAKTQELDVYGSRDGDTNSVGVKWFPRDPSLKK